MDGLDVNGLSPADRDVAIVFQQYSLYPTMTVYDNMAFPLRAPSRKVPEAEIKKKIEDAAEKLRITHLLSEEQPSYRVEKCSAFPLDGQLSDVRGYS